MLRNTSENLSNKWHQTPLETLPHHQPTAQPRPSNKLPPVIKCTLCTDKHNLVRCQPFTHYDIDKRNKFVWGSDCVLTIQEKDMATCTVPPSTPAKHATINTTQCCIEKSPPEKPRMQYFVSKFNHMMSIQTKLTVT